MLKSDTSAADSSHPDPNTLAGSHLLPRFKRTLEYDPNSVVLAVPHRFSFHVLGNSFSRIAPKSDDMPPSAKMDPHRKMKVRRSVSRSAEEYLAKLREMNVHGPSKMSQEMNRYTTGNPSNHATRSEQKETTSSLASSGQNPNLRRMMSTYASSSESISAKKAFISREEVKSQMPPTSDHGNSVYDQTAENLSSKDKLIANDGEQARTLTGGQ